METDVDPIAPVSHLAIVMDGNGRWAQQRNLPRQEGHAAGVETVRRAVRFIADAGIDCLTLFSFSTENWQRPSGEVKFLMRLLKHYIEADLAELHKNDVRVKIIGKRQGLDAQLVKLIEHAEQVTAANTRMRLQIAFNYGAREEIAEAARAWRCGWRKASLMLQYHAGSGRCRIVDARATGPGFGHSHQRRKSLEQFPAMAMRVFGVLFYRCVVARFRCRKPTRRATSLSPARAAVWPG